MTAKQALCILLFITQSYFASSVISDDRGYFEEILRNLDANAAKERAQQWLLSQRDSEWGWGSDSETANSIMALQLSQSSWAESKLEYELSTKQLALQYALDMAGFCCREGDAANELTTGRVAQYIDAFLTVCKDPRNFYGHDLVSKLKAMKPRYDFEVGYRALALCNAGILLSQEVVDQMENIVKNDASSIPDTKAINLMALVCANKQGNFEDEKVDSLATQLGSTQKEDGSFGNIWSTAIVVQSLLPFSDQDHSWNSTAALSNILQSQDVNDGSFTNKLGAFFVLPLLDGKNLGDVNKVRCPSTELQPASPVPSVSSEIINVEYSIWKGDPVADKYTISLQVKNFTTMYELMVLAQEEDERFKFTYKESSFGYYVTAIGGLEQDTATNSYWVYGVLRNPDDTDIIAADRSIDQFHLTENEEHVVFWYKPLKF